MNGHYNKGDNADVPYKISKTMKEEKSKSTIGYILHVKWDSYE
jgi:hypothetical protein